MSRYILDTDHVSLILCNHPQVTVNASLHQIAVTVITVQELFNGWIGRINDPSAVHNLPALPKAIRRRFGSVASSCMPMGWDIERSREKLVLATTR